MEPDKLSRGLACWPFRPAIFEIRDGDHPYRFSTWRQSDRKAGGWAILSAHRQARRHAVGF